MKSIWEKLNNEMKKIGGDLENVMWQGGFNTAIETAKIIINVEMGDFNLIKVPKKIKLSELVNRLKVDLDDCLIYFNKDNNMIGYDCYYNEHSFVFTGLVLIGENNKIEKIYTYETDSFYDGSELKWLYELWLGESEIEVDL